MKKIQKWYECDYCGIKVDGTTNIIDSFLEDEYIIDICNKQVCLDKHLERVEEELTENNSTLFWTLDNLLFEYEVKDDKYKVKWNKDDEWHNYIRKNLVNKIMPVYYFNVMGKEDNHD